MQIKKQVISKEEADQIQAWLDGADVPMENKVFSFSFEDYVEIDVQVITEGDHAYLNVILFKQGREILCLDPQYNFVGCFHFTFRGEDYKAIITTEPPNSVKYFTEKD